MAAFFSIISFTVISRHYACVEIIVDDLSVRYFRF